MTFSIKRLVEQQEVEKSKRWRISFCSGFFDSVFHFNLTPYLISILPFLNFPLSFKTITLLGFDRV